MAGVPPPCPGVTPLARLIASRIGLQGPINLAEYMQLCLLHPRHGYYATRDPFGAAGDFTTAPEISQMFGELLGLALGQAWLDQGAPDDAVLAELGPGRGTLMEDARRALSRSLGWKPAIALVEASAHLRKVQQARLDPVLHLDTVDDLPDRPLFLLANEFFDALPVRQFQRVAEGWSERLVTLNDTGGLCLGLGPTVSLPWPGDIGTVIEERASAVPIVARIAHLIAVHGGAAIVVDYGTWDGQGDSLQALRRHAPEGILDHPGEADLTAHVDFAPLAGAARDAGAAVSLPTTQGALLDALGIGARAARLAAAAPASAPEIEAARHRLTDAAQMGHLFKALAFWRADAPPPPGFAAAP